MLVFSDLHLRDESAELVLGTILPAIRQEALDRGEMVIACLGDALHFRYRVPAPLLNGLRDWCLQVTADGTKIIWLPGNHDQYDVAGRNALEPLASIPGVIVHTQPAIDDHGLWIPYRKNHDDIADAIGSAASGIPCFLHHGVRSAWMNDNIQDSDGVPLDLLSQFQIVMCGHYHKRQRVGPAVSYIGSPYQTKADEAGQEKGFSLWDGTRLEPVTMQWGKRYHRIELKAGESLDMSGISQDDDVRVTAAAGVDAEAVGQALANAGVTNHTVTPEVVVDEQRLNVEAGASLVQYAEAYVGEFAGELHPRELMDVYCEVIQ